MSLAFRRADADHAPWIPLARGVCGVPGQGKPWETQQFLVCFMGKMDENGWETGKMDGNMVMKP